MALTGVVLVLSGLPGAAARTAGPAPSPDAAALSGAPPQGAQETPQEEPREAPQEPEPELGESAAEATGPLRDLVEQFYAILPRLAVAAILLLAAWLVVRLTRPVFRSILRGWQRAEAARAVMAIGIWLLAVAAAFSVLAGDVRALVGSVGLFGLALSWALQTPIESFTGWLLNSFKGYYRVGDRIAVGDLHGDVFRIDVLTTTVWETGAPDSPAPGAQTGALVTFPNLEVLRSNIVNYTLDFPYVWSETTVTVSDDSDLAYAMRLVREVADRVVGLEMAEPARRYRDLLERAGLGAGVAAEPQVFVSAAETAARLTVRYLVPARSRRQWGTDLLLALGEELARPEHRDRVEIGYPRQEVELTEFGRSPPS